MKNICVFCASGKEFITPFQDGVIDLVRYAKANNISFIYGGAKVGLMGLLADSCISGGVPITGIITEQIAQFELQHDGVISMHISANMHTRKKHMYDLSDAFIVLPGSIGTLDEFFEILCWSKLHIHQKPIGVLNLKNYYDTLLQFIHEKIDQQLMDADILDYFVQSSSLDDLMILMQDWKCPKSSNLEKESKKYDKN